LPQPAAAIVGNIFVKGRGKPRGQGQAQRAGASPEGWGKPRAQRAGASPAPTELM